MTRQAFVGVMHPKFEDGGKSITCEINDGSPNGMFITIHSWDDNGKLVPGGRTEGHDDIKKFLGKKVIIFMESVGE